MNLFIFTLFALVFSQNCTKDYQCNNGICKQIDINSSICMCNNMYVSKDNEICNYKQVNKLEAFLLSWFVGFFGVDWFILARGNPGYIVAGVFKLLTVGGLGIWWLVDWIRILTDDFHDGNGIPIGPWI